MSQIIAAVLVPSGLVTLLIFAAGVTLFTDRRRRLSVILLASAALLYVAFGSSLTTQWLMGSLEREFPAGQVVEPPPSLNTVVVLTGYAKHISSRPITGQVNSASALRLLEAARLVARNRQLTVLISGGGEVPSVMKDLLVQLGVPGTRIEIEAASSNTYESAVHLRERLAGRPFYLATSAGHMPRAMRVFRKQGLHAIPAPSDYLSPDTLTDMNIFPSGRNLAISDLAVHEYLAMLEYWLLDRI